MARRKLDAYPPEAAAPLSPIDLAEGAITNPHRSDGDDWACHHCDATVLAGWAPSDLACIGTVGLTAVFCPACGSLNLMPGTTDLGKRTDRRLSVKAGVTLR